MITLPRATIKQKLEDGIEVDLQARLFRELILDEGKELREHTELLNLKAAPDDAFSFYAEAHRKTVLAKYSHAIKKLDDYAHLLGKYEFSLVEAGSVGSQGSLKSAPFLSIYFDKEGNVLGNEKLEMSPTGNQARPLRTYFLLWILQSLQDAITE